MQFLFHAANYHIGLRQNAINLQILNMIGGWENFTDDRRHVSASRGIQWGGEGRRAHEKTMGGVPHGGGSGSGAFPRAELGGGAAGRGAGGAADGEDDGTGALRKK